MHKGLAVLLLLAGSLSADVLQFADRARIVNVSDPQIAPDGKQIAVVVSRANLAENRFDTEIALVDVATGAQRAITNDRRGVAQPRWSPDGTRLAFLAMQDGKRQVWIALMNGGDPKRVTSAANGVQQYAWDPSGSRIAYVCADEPPTKPDAQKHNRAFELGDDDYLTNAAVLSSHIWLVAADGTNAKRLTSGDWSLPIARPPGPLPSPIQWSPDGKSIAFARADTPHSGNSETARIALVDVETGNIRRVTNASLAESQPVFSPDGSQLALIHPHNAIRQSENRIWLASSTNIAAATELTKDLDRNLQRAFFLPDGQSLLVGGHDATTTALWLQPLRGGTAQRLDIGDIEPVSGFSIDANVGRDGAIAFTGTTPSHPRELYYLASPTAKPRRLTNNNAAFDAIELAKSERITFRNDGFDLDGVVTTPPHYDATKKYPLVLYVHGGPRASSTLAFSFIPQILAAQNWIVFQPNYRGSDNLGDRTTRAIIMDAGAGPGRDVMAGLEVVKKRYSIDTDRIAVGGWSYGGYMTSWLIGHYPIFKAAVSGAAVNNMLDQYTLGDFNVQRGVAWGSPYVGDNAKIYVEQSPITYAAKIKTPTLILSNLGDMRVPVTQSFQMYHALKDNGVTTKFIAYPLSGHNADDPTHQSDVDHRYVEWFSTYLK
jgi:dipeptidyl aminopeptidase/acylaminoacyl peptidase